MGSLIILLALGWLLYKALFPEVAPYYDKVPHYADPHPRQKSAKGKHQRGYNSLAKNSFLDNPEDVSIDPCQAGYSGDYCEREPDLIRSMEENRSPFEIGHNLMEDSHSQALDWMDKHAPHSLDYDDFLSGHVDAIEW